MLTTLVLGGYGNFGARICRALALDFGASLIVAGRDASRAQAFAATLGQAAKGIGLDLDAPGFSERLRELGVGLLIHTAGPFQHQATGVAQAAAAAGAHYIDLADGRRFVCDFPARLHDTFAAACLTAISGASTVPALSSAVVAHLSKGWQRITAIDICIAPAQTAPRGKATLAGVLSYCGEPIDVWADGHWQKRTGWADPRQVAFARMQSRRGALCDIPDLELFPAHFNVSTRVMFRAALEVPLAQRAFAALAALRSRGLMGSPARLAGLLAKVSPAFDFRGTGLGGMVVRIEGVDGSGRVARRAWHIVAGDDHGPEIPCMAAILLARRLADGTARGTAMPAGAFACLGLLELAEFQPEFDRWGMVTDVVDETP